MKSKILVLAASLLASTNAMAISVNEFTLEALVKWNETPVELSEYKFDRDGERMSSQGFDIIKTPEYEAGMAFIETQTYLSDYHKKAYEKVVFATAYLLQNVNDGTALTEFANYSSLTDLCAYFGVDEITKFAIEGMLTKSLANDVYKDHFLAAHAHIAIPTHLEFSKAAFGLLPYCSKFVDGTFSGLEEKTQTL